MSGPFSIGRRWRVEKPAHRGCRAFDFVIVGPPTETNTTTASERYKRCRVECKCGLAHGDFEADYSHKHLKKYAEPV